MKVCPSPAGAVNARADLQFLGMDKMQRSMAVYVKSLSKRAEGDNREKQLPGGHLGSSMVTHGEDFEPDSEFGNCLSCMLAPLYHPCPTPNSLSTGSGKRTTCSRARNIRCISNYVMARRH